jgi:hypothetical protein
MLDYAFVQLKHFRVIQAKQSAYSFNKAIIGSRKHGRNFLLTNIGRGLSPGPISISSSSSANVNTYPSFPSSVKSILQMDKEDNKKNFGRLSRSAAPCLSLLFETLQKE